MPLGYAGIYTMYYKDIGVFLILRSALHDGPRLVSGFDNQIVANGVADLKQINP
jgi:hypothetical protein